MSDATLEKTGSTEADQRVIRVDKAEQCCAQAQIATGAAISNVAAEVIGLHPDQVLWLEPNGQAGKGPVETMPTTACKVVNEDLSIAIATPGIQVAISVLLGALANCVSKRNCGDCMRRRAFPQKPQRRKWTTKKHRPRV